MRENNKGSLIILTIIGIATLLVAVIGATFAYFSVTVKYETEPTPAVVESSTMLVTFKTLNELTYKGAIPGRPSLSSDPVAQAINNTLSFTLTSAMNMNSTTQYNVYLVVDSNNFESDNLVYLMSQERSVTNEATSNKTTGNVGKQYFPVGEEENLYIKDDINGDNIIGNEEYVGIIKSENKEGDKILIATGDLGSHGSIDTWTLEIWLREIGVEQNEDQGKIFRGHIEVEPVNQDPVTYEPDKITTQ